MKVQNTQLYMKLTNQTGKYNIDKSLRFFANYKNHIIPYYKYQIKISIHIGRHLYL